MTATVPEPITILVVEDDAGDYGLLRANLCEAGLAALGTAAASMWAKTLAEAAALARLPALHVVLLDLSLPDSAGLATVRSMRALSPDLAIVVLTGNDDQALAADALEAGAAQAKHLKLLYHWRGPVKQSYLADSHRVRQMLSNLVGNAIKFTLQGTVRMEGQEMERSGNTVLLQFSVFDSGIGFQAEKLDLLFKPFSQADNSTTRNFGGSGLGLSIVYSLARAMGGEVGVQSVPGKGSRFWFRVRADLVEPDHERRHTQRQSDESNTPAPPWGGPCALATTAETFNFALTADAFEEDQQHCREVGMDDFLTKPLAIAALQTALTRWLPSVRNAGARNPQATFNSSY
jgi:CheY-like chemotaxis protein